MITRAAVTTEYLLGSSPPSTLIPCGNAVSVLDGRRRATGAVAEAPVQILSDSKALKVSANRPSSVNSARKLDRNRGPVAQAARQATR
jgi:hypothetical protein